MAIRIRRRYENNEIAVRSWWAWWPAICRNYEDDRIIKETRWLERVYVVSKYNAGYMDSPYWSKIRFTDALEYKKQIEFDREILERPA